MLEASHQEHHHACRSCGATLRHDLLDMGAQPVSNALLPKSGLAHGERFYPLTAMLCGVCRLGQLVNSPPAEVHFHKDYLYFSSYSSIWLSHCENYVREISERFDLRMGQQILEVASNDGYMLRFFKERGFQVLGIEPSESVANAAQSIGIPTEVRFFNEAAGAELARRGISPSLIIANNVMAHVPDLNDFVRGFPAVMSDHTVLTCEVHYLRDLIEKNQFDTFYHEHYSYFTIAAARRLFEANGLRLFDVERLPTHGGSLRLYGALASSSHTATARLMEHERAEDAFLGDPELLVAEFQARVEETSSALTDFLRRLRREGKRAAGFGAPAKATTFLNIAGIRRTLLPFIVDSNPAKQGRLLPGVHIPVLDPRAIAREQPDYIVILPWNLRGEIAEQAAFVREWGGRFVTAIPQLEVF